MRYPTTLKLRDPYENALMSTFRYLHTPIMVCLPNPVLICKIPWEFFSFSDMDGKHPDCQLAMIEMNLIGRKQ